MKRPYMLGHVESRYSADEEGRWKFTSGGNVLTGSGATNGESGQSWRGFDPSKKNRHWAVPGFLTAQMPEEFKRLSVLGKLECLYNAGLIDITEGAAWPTPVRFLMAGDGQPIQDIWAYQPYTQRTVHGTEQGIDHDVMWLGPTDPERVDWQTQKPIGLLERIIRSSCPVNGVVLDPFCGCGTAVVAAQELRRTWFGIDITARAIDTIVARLTAECGLSKDAYEIVQYPFSAPDARRLATENKFHFQRWALERLGVDPSDIKPGADKGIDGKLYFSDGDGGRTKRVILSVKAGKHVGPDAVRDLRGVLDRDGFQIGVIVTLDKLTPATATELASGRQSYQTVDGRRYPRLQHLTVDDILDGKVVEFSGGDQLKFRPRGVTLRERQPEAIELDFEEPASSIDLRTKRKMAKAPLQSNRKTGRRKVR